MPKPTPLQIDTLRAIAAGDVYMHNVGTAAFRVHGASPGAVGRLVHTLQWARWPKGAVGTQACEITDAGRAVLDSNT